MQKILITIWILLVLAAYVKGKTNAKKKDGQLDEGFKERIMNIIDSKGEMTQEERARMFQNLKVAGGKNFQKTEEIVENDETSEENEKPSDKIIKNEDISIEEARKEDL